MKLTRRHVLAAGVAGAGAAAAGRSAQAADPDLVLKNFQISFDGKPIEIIGSVDEDGGITHTPYGHRVTITLGSSAKDRTQQLETLSNIVIRSLIEHGRNRSPDLQKPVRIVISNETEPNPDVSAEVQLSSSMREIYDVDFQYIVRGALLEMVARSETPAQGASYCLSVSGVGTIQINFQAARPGESSFPAPDKLACP